MIAGLATLCGMGERLFERREHMKRFEKLSIFSTEVALALGTISSTVLADGRGDVPDADSVMQGLGTNSSVDSIAKPIMGLFGSTFDAVRAVCIALLVISVILVAIGFITSGGNGGKREESKSQLFYVIGAAIGIGAAITLITAFLKLGASV